MRPRSCDRRSRSGDLYRRACDVLVGGVNSPVRSFGSVGGNPVFVDRVEGAFIHDVDGNRYVDLVGAWGPAIVGHAHPQVVEAVQAAAAKGLSFGACCEAEARLAEIIINAVPRLDKLRFVNSGTEACMSALRLARAATGRSKIVKFSGCYHGHVDSLLVAAGSGAASFGRPDSAGVPRAFAESTLVLPFNDLDAVTAVFNDHRSDVAAVIVEPVAGNMGCVPPVDGFLHGLRDLCDRAGSLLIFDEVMTGFRVAWGGYQNLCGLTPDITCFGKVIGGGMPVAAFGGADDLMSLLSPIGPTYQAGTLSGNPLGMAAGIATLQLCMDDGTEARRHEGTEARRPQSEPGAQATGHRHGFTDGHGFYDGLNVKAVRLADGLALAAKDAGVPLCTSHCGGMFGLSFSDRPVRNFEDAKRCDHDAYATFFRGMLDRGVWLPPSGYEAMFVSAAHDDDALSHVLAAATESFRSCRS